MGFLLGGGLLLYLGRNLVQASALRTWGITLGAMTAVTVLLASVYRLRLALRESLKQLALKEAELNFAREVQNALFPRHLPCGNGLEFAASCTPARGIGGDYYDVMQFPDGRLVFAIADISGKGISAAILVANLQALLRMLTQSTRSPREICSSLNQHLLQVTGESRFATVFYAEWDPLSRQLRYANAGHHPPVMIGSSNGRVLTEGGIPIGMFPDSDFQEGEVKLQPHDLLVLYSDGITEAMSRAGEEFGEARLKAFIEARAHQPLGDIQSAVLTAVRDWSGDEPEDDMTILLVRATGKDVTSDEPHGLGS